MGTMAGNAGNQVRTMIDGRKIDILGVDILPC
jgi:hypothetical protein